MLLLLLPWVTGTHTLWVSLRISTTVVDTGTPSFQTVTTHSQEAAFWHRHEPRDAAKIHCNANTAKSLHCLPADLWARLRVAGAVGLRSGQRSAEIVRIRFVIDTAEDQPGLVAW